MTEELLCRTCARPAPYIFPLFARPESYEKYVLALEIATGLQMELDDGLPQHICKECSQEVNNVLRFRRNSRRAQSRFIELGYRRKTTVVCVKEPPPCTITSETEIKEEPIDSTCASPNDNHNFDCGLQDIDFTRLDHDNFNSFAKSDNSDSLPKMSNIDSLSKMSNIDYLSKISNIDSFSKVSTADSLPKVDARDSQKKINESTMKVEVEIVETKDYERMVPERCNESDDREDSLARKLKENVPLHLLWRLKPPRNKVVLDEFLDRSSPLYTCKVCRKIYKHTGSFVDHTVVHTGLEYMCDRCGKVFRNAPKLLRHQRSIHGAARDSKLHCPHCEFHALDTVRLKEHIRTHTGERPFICDACGAGFTGRELLVQHLTVHITERTVQCDQCPAKFRTRKCLNTHRSKRHKPRLWRYQCAYCPNVYSVFNNCRCHARKAHGVPHAQQKPPIRVPVQL